MNCVFCKRHIPSHYDYNTCDICGRSILEEQLKFLSTKINNLEKKACAIQGELSKLLCEYEGKVIRLQRLNKKSPH